MRRAADLPCELWTGAGNDFVLLDARTVPSRVSRRALARRACGGACLRPVDGLLLVAGRRAELWNRDGSHPAFCGNGARCVAARLLAETGEDRIRLRFGGVRLVAWRAGSGIAVRVPAPRVRALPIARATLEMELRRGAAQLLEARWIAAGVPHLCLRLARRRGPGALGPGRTEALRAVGARLRRARAFGAAGTNVTFVWEPARESGPRDIRTYERGVEDLTRACGSGALAAGRMLIGPGPGRSVRLRVASGAQLTVERVGSGWILQGPARRLGRGRLVLAAPAGVRRGPPARRPAG